MEGNTIISMAGGFIALSIMLGVGTLVLGGAVTDCTSISDYKDTTVNSTGGTEPPLQEQGGWSEQCLNNNTQSQSGYSLLMVSLIVLAAAIILIVVRMLSA